MKNFILTTGLCLSVLIASAQTPTFRWVSGSDQVEAISVITQTNPGPRIGAMSFTDSLGNYWLYGGEGYDKTTNKGLFNDLWKYDQLDKSWNWEAGNDLVNASIKKDFNNNALLFDGIDDKILIDTDIVKSSDSYTVELWMKTTTDGNIISRSPQDENGSFDGWSLNIRQDGQLWFTVKYLGIKPVAPDLRDNAWHHLAVSFDVNYNGIGDKVQIYVDGVLCDFESVGGGASSGDPFKFWNYDERLELTEKHIYVIGDAHGGISYNPGYFEGAIDDLRIWNFARRASDINLSRFSSLTGKEEGLALYYNFDQGEAGGANNMESELASGIEAGVNGELVSFEANQTFIGEMAEVRVWNKNLTDVDLQTNMTTRMTGNETDLVVAFDFAQGVSSADNTAQTTALDLTTNAYNATLTNFSLTAGSSSNYINDGLPKLPETFVNTTGSIDLFKADLNGDSYVDIISPNRWSGKLTVLLNDGTGNFPSKTDYTLGSDVIATAVGYFNDDDFLDIVATVVDTSYPMDENSIVILFGDGTGAFPTSMSMNPGDDTGAQGLKVGDMNNDGFDDIIVAFQSARILRVYLGFKNETFDAIDLPNALAGELTLADFNKDGNLDVIGSYNTSLGIYLGDGQGNLPDYKAIPVAGGQIFGLESADINNDGNYDLIYSSFNQELLIKLGSGLGTFGEEFKYRTDENPRRLRVEDLNDDGNIDIALTNEYGRSLFLYYGDGTGAMTAPLVLPIIPVFPEGLAVADFDQNGTVDIAVGTRDWNVITVFRGDDNFQSISDTVNALNFDGEDDFVAIPNLQPFDTTFTWEAWVKTSSDGVLFSFSPSESSTTFDQGSFAIVIENSRLKLNVATVGVIAMPEPSSEAYGTNLTDGLWHHLAVSISFNDAANEIVVFYRDGSQEYYNNDYDFDAFLSTAVVSNTFVSKIGAVNSGYFTDKELPQHQNSNWATGVVRPASAQGIAYGAMWESEESEFYIFGGQREGGLHNSIVKYNPSTQNWDFVKGTSQAYAASNYGTMGVADIINIPPPMMLTSATVDTTGNIWVFGGATISQANTTGNLNDLWMYNTTTNEWTWKNGTQLPDQAGDYGSLGIKSPSNRPGGRSDHLAWSDDKNNIWVFGGIGYDANGEFGYLSDLWMYDISLGEWTWVNGSNLINQGGIYGDQAVSTNQNQIGARTGAYTWVDKESTVWVFGGIGYDKFGLNLGYLTDLWSYSPTDNQWTWHSGDDFSNGTGIYYQQGLAASEYLPGSRSSGNAWFNESSEEIWLFGGKSSARVGTGLYNDLWKYKPATAEWTWLSGLNSTASASDFGQYGSTLDGSKPNPGARHGQVGWKTPDGNFWMLGGTRVGSSSYGMLNDLWLYEPLKNRWSYKGGNLKMELNDGVYGAKGLANATNIPKSRWHGTGWADDNGRLWFFGGLNMNSETNELAWLGDLWVYDPASGFYTWMGGDNSFNRPGEYGIQGEPSVGNMPGARSSSATWKDNEGNFWLFGGYERFKYNNDLWKFNPNTLEWTWVAGSKSQNTPGTYGTRGVASDDNVIGSRRYHTGWVGKDGNFWAFGGTGYNGQGEVEYLNDLWMFDVTTSQWTWIHGSKISGEDSGIYGTKGEMAPENTPSGRDGHIGWSDDSGNLWMFGGYGYSKDTLGNSTFGYLNDLWKFDVNSKMWVWMAGSKEISEEGAYGSLDVLSESNVIGARARGSAFKGDDKNFWLFGGRISTSFQNFNDVWEMKFTPGTPLVEQPDSIGQTKIRFSYDEPWAKSYQLQVSTSSGFSSVLMDANTPTNQTIVPSLIPGTNYYYRVKGINDIGESSYSTPINVLTLPATPAFKTGGWGTTALTSTSVTIHWEATAGVISNYQLSISTDKTFEDSELIHSIYSNAVMGASSTSESVPDLMPGTVYYALLRSVNNSGQSPYSQPLQLLTKPATPEIDSSSVISDLRQDGFIINWSRVPEITNGFLLDISTDEAFLEESSYLSGYQAKTISKDVFSIEVTGLQAGTTYYARVSSYNAAGNSLPTNTISVLTLPESPLFINTTSVTNITQTSVDVDWQPVSKIYDGYLMEVSIDINFTNSSFYLEGYGLNNRPKEIAKEMDSLTIVGLSPGNEYFVRIRAYNNAGESPNSNIIMIKTIPLAPQFGVVKNIMQTSATVGWSSPAGANVYFLDVNSSTDYATETAFYEAFPKAVAFEVLTGLQPGTAYSIRVASGNESGNSGSLETPDYGESSFTTRPATPRIENIEVITDISQTSATVNWLSALGIVENYYIDVSTDSDFADGMYLDGFEHLQVPITQISQQVNGMIAGAQYYIRLFSQNATGLSTPTAVVTVLTLPQTPQFDPVNYRLDVGQSFGYIEWIPVENTFDGYQLEISLDENFNATNSFLDGYGLNNIPKTIDKNTTDDFFDNLSPGTIYYAHVRSFNKSGNSPYSNTVSLLTIPDTPLLDDPINFTQVSFELNWKDISGADGYEVDISTNFFQTLLPEFNSKQITASGLIVSDLDPGEEYQVRVRATNSSGSSNSALLLDVITITDTPIARDATNSSAKVFTANWDPVSGAVYYVLEVSTDGFDTFHFNAQVNNSNPVQMTDLTAGLTYQYRLKSGNNSGQSPYSNVIEVKAQNNSQSLNIADVAYNDEFIIASSEVPVSVSLSGATNVTEVTLRHKGLLATDWSDFIALTLEGDSYTFSIDVTMLDEIGVAFEVYANDNITFVESKGHEIYWAFSDAKSEEIPLTKFGGGAADWQMISIPYVMEDNLIASIFNELGALKYKKQWRLMHYSDGAYLDAGEGINKIELGASYWFNTIAEVAIDIGAGKANTTMPFQLVLNQGWNQIGNPYNVAIDWRNILIDNQVRNIVGDLIVYDLENQSFKKSISLVPFSGAFVWSDIDRTIDVSPVSLNSGGRIETSLELGSQIDEEAWQMPLRLMQGGRSTEIATIGMAPDGANGKDQYDELTIPRFIKYTEMYTYHPDYFYPSFSKDIAPTSQQKTWDFILASNAIQGNVSLSWADSDLHASNAKIWLVDEIRGVVTDMSTVSSYRFNFNGKQNFTLHFSSDPNYKVVPKNLVLGDAYPNPFVGVTKIPLFLPDAQTDYQLDLAIFNMEGKRVQTIAKGFYSPGFYEFEFENNGQINLTGGLYIYRLVFESSNIPASQKKLVIKQ